VALLLLKSEKTGGDHQSTEALLLKQYTKEKGVYNGHSEYGSQKGLI
jgi:hypothetical protein